MRLPGIGLFMAFLVLASALGCGKNEPVAPPANPGTESSATPEDTVKALIAAAQAKDVAKLADQFDDPWANLYRSEAKLDAITKEFTELLDKKLGKSKEHMTW